MKDVTMPATSQALKQLHLPFSEDKISWRAGSRQGGMAKALPYIDNRVIMDALDEIVGAENWYNEYTEVISGGLLLAVRCALFLRLESGWVGKSDAAPVSVSGDLAVKGAYSDAMKRAAVHWGLGRYLYAFSAPWVEVNERGGLLEVPVLPATMLPAGSVVRVPVLATVATADAPVAPASVKPAKPVAVKAIKAVLANETVGLSDATPLAPAVDSTQVAESAVVVPKAVAVSAPASSDKPTIAVAPAMDAIAEPLNLSEEQQTLVAGLLQRLGKLPSEMLRQYVEGPKGQEKLTAAARVHVLERIAAFDLTAA